jgi:hypothetical protein
MGTARQAVVMIDGRTNRASRGQMHGAMSRRRRVAVRGRCRPGRVTKHVKQA